MSFTMVKPKVAEAIKQAGLVDEKGIIFYCGGETPSVASIKGDIIYRTPFKESMLGFKLLAEKTEKTNRSEIVSAKFEKHGTFTNYCVLSLPYGKTLKLWCIDDKKFETYNEPAIMEILKMWSIPEAK